MQIGTISPRRICSFEFDDRGEAISLLTWFYRNEMRHEERDPSILRGYVEQVIDWAMNPDKSCLMLAGGLGCGKTTMLNAFCRMIQRLYYSDISYERRGFQWEAATTVADWATEDRARYEEFMRCEWAAIDDIGTEPNEVTNFGRLVYPVRDLLMYRYENDLLTIVSTNLTPRQLSDKYGERLGDRMLEMFQMMVIKENSYRL